MMMGFKKKLLQQKRDDARRFLKFLHPELGVGMSCFPLLLFVVTWLGGGYVLKSEKECRNDRMQNAGSASILGLCVVVLMNRKLTVKLVVGFETTTLIKDASYVGRAQREVIWSRLSYLYSRESHQQVC